MTERGGPPTRSRAGTLLAAALATALLAAAAPGPAAESSGAPAAPAPPGALDRCPVCGMFVAKFPAWAAQAVFADGSREFFDGAKDLLRYLGEEPRSGGARRPGEIVAAFVTDYYSLEPVDGRTAFYVAGSDVLGPMGAELIPFGRRADAEEFLRDHRGRRIVGFEEAGRELESLVR